ncbi:MAG: suppressor of fused domain protein [Gordonia sp. (in: high G+C Gram-positive bacteria)]|uniref:suppressor of fused domain protein n=1 Tax=Gordonia sp. (in: high G+C Gram-positive bacteria) TaxID=84139 RepID=UPI003BB6F90A
MPTPVRPCADLGTVYADRVSSVPELVAAHLTEVLGAAPQRASVTFLGVEPIDVLRYADAEARLVVFATAGCARHPMHDPAELVPDPVVGPRVELVVRMQPSAPLAGLHKSLATLAAAPAVEGLILGDDSLVDLQEPLWSGAVCSAYLLTRDLDVPALPLGGGRDPVAFLRAVPITANEAAWVRLKGAQALREAWDEGGVDVTDPTRGGVTPS